MKVVGAPTFKSYASRMARTELAAQVRRYLFLNTDEPEIFLDQLAAGLVDIFEKARGSNGKVDT